MIPDPVFLLALARACSAAYELDPTARASQLAPARIREIAYYTATKDATALLCQPEDVSGPVLAVPGTQASALELPSIFANFELRPVLTGSYGEHVPKGYWDQGCALLDVLPSLAGVILVGHSMGGCVVEQIGNDVRSHLVVSFGAPMCGDPAYWRDASAYPVRVVHGADFAPDWPVTGPWVQPPGNMIWLHDGKAEEIAARPGTNDSFDDHAIAAYIAALEALIR